MAQLENFRLKVFRAVAEHLNFHDAAEHLFLTQPAVSLQIKTLENDLGVRLFDRARGGITLTRQGSVLLSYANKAALSRRSACFWKACACRGKGARCFYAKRRARATKVSGK